MARSEVAGRRERAAEKNERRPKVSFLVNTQLDCALTMFVGRFRSLIFWLYADNEKLHPRLDGRVDSMIEVRVDRSRIQSQLLTASALTARAHQGAR